MIPGIDEAFRPLANALGNSVDNLKLLVSFLLSYPLASLLKRIPDASRWQKNVLIIAVGLFYLVGLFNLWGGLVALVVDAATTYAIAYYIDGSLMPWIVFIFLMSHMAYTHVWRQLLYDLSVVDISGAQMVLIMKLGAFAWNVHDGRLKPELMTPEQKDRAVYKFPDFLDFAGYVMFFPSLMIGPAFDYVDYRRWLDITMFDSPDPKLQVIGKGRRIPHSGVPAAWKAAQGFAWLFLFLQFSGWYNNELVLDDSWMQYSFFVRVWHVYMLGITSRMKYYSVWALTEGACILAGIGYNGVDPKTGRARWDKCENVSPWSIETAQNSRGYLEGWNKNTNHWLRNYVYLRLTPKGKKPGFRASLATFMTSAFWHGFYPGYYLTFAVGSFLQTVAKNFRRYVRPFFLTPDGKSSTQYKIYYDIASYIATQLAFCFCTAPFVILGFADSIKVWARVYFYCIVGIALTMAFFASPAKAYLRKAIEKRNHPYKPKTLEQETRHPPALGLPHDPGREIDEAVDEIIHEVEVRRRRGSKIEMPSGEGLKRAVEKKLGRKIELNTQTPPGKIQGEKAYNNDREKEL